MLRSVSNRKVSDPYGTEYLRVEFPHPITLKPIWHITPLPVKIPKPDNEHPKVTDPPTLSIRGGTGIVGFPAKMLSAGYVALVQLSMLGLNKICACQVNKLATSTTVRFMTRVVPGPKSMLMMLEGIMAIAVDSTRALTLFAVAIVAVMTIIASSMNSIFSSLLCIIFLSFLVITFTTGWLLRVVESNSTTNRPAVIRGRLQNVASSLVLLRFEAFGYEAYVFHVYDVVLYYICGRVPVVRA